MDQKDIQNEKIGVDMFVAAKLHTIGFSGDLFLQSIETVENPELKTSLKNLSLLFLGNQLIENAAHFLEFNLIESKTVTLVKEMIADKLDTLHYESLVLAEVFIYSEKTFYSALANENEKPYENLYNLAKTYGALNQVDLSRYYADTITKTSLEVFPKL